MDRRHHLLITLLHQRWISSPNPLSYHYYLPRFLRSLLLSLRPAFMPFFLSFFLSFSLSSLFPDWLHVVFGHMRPIKNSDNLHWFGKMQFSWLFYFKKKAWFTAIMTPSHLCPHTCVPNTTTLTCSKQHDYGQFICRMIVQIVYLQSRVNQEDNLSCWVAVPEGRLLIAQYSHYMFLQ